MRLDRRAYACSLIVWLQQGMNLPIMLGAFQLANQQNFSAGWPGGGTCAAAQSAATASGGGWRTAGSGCRSKCTSRNFDASLINRTGGLSKAAFV